MSIEVMAKSRMHLNVNLLNIILSIKDEDVKIINNIITSTLMVWPSKSGTRASLYTPVPDTIFIHACKSVNIYRQ